jgi:hypothetical protein
MTDQQLVISAVREAGRIISEHLEPGPLPFGKMATVRKFCSAGTRDRSGLWDIKGH